MTVPSAIQLLGEIRQLGGHLRAKDGGKLGVVLAEPDLSRLLPAVRERKPDLLVLLRYPATACPACDGDHYWRDGVGLWRCGKCDPDALPDPFGPMPAASKMPWPSWSCGLLSTNPPARLVLTLPVIVQPPNSGSLRVLHIAAASAFWAAGGPRAFAPGAAPR